MLLIVALAACGGDAKPKTAEQLRKDYGPQVEAKIAKMIAAAKLPAGAPSAPPVPLELRGTTKFGDDPGHATNAIAVSSGELGEAAETADEHKNHSFQFQDDSDNHVYNARKVLTDPPAYRQTNEIALKELLAARYLLIVSGSMSDGHVTSSGFAPGEAEGTVVLVDLDAGKRLDEFTFTAKSSDKLYTSSSSTGSSDADEKIKRDLRHATTQAIRDGIAKKWPGSGLPINWGY